MAFWLFKSEPGTWSFTDQKACGAKGTEWTGVRNYQARNFMRAMQVGERGFFYHSNEGKAVVGIVEVCAPAHTDSTAEDPKWDCVDIRAVMDMPSPVSLEAVKTEPRLKAIMLVANSRLSVQPVTDAEFRLVCEMGGLDPERATGTE